jgi:lipid-A-disaccharide synthase
LANSIFISAGEASGEAYGAQLIHAARKLGGAVEFFGLGGPKMRAAGCDIAVESHDVAVVGLAEVVRHLPRIYSRYRTLLHEIDRRKPKAAVLIDFPDFNFKLAKQLHKRGIPVIYFVSPQLWAWRPSRIELVKKYVTKMLVIFPFEEAWYRERGVDAEYVGHPLVDCLPQRTQGDAKQRQTYAEKWGLDPSKQWIALLPGSRKSEIDHHAALLEVPFLLGTDFEYLIPIASTLTPEQVRRSRQIEAELRQQEGIDLAEAAQADIAHHVAGASQALAHSRAAVVASGTATVEAALAGTPFVVVYRLSGLTWKLGRRMVKLKHFAMPNLITGREVVPELIQNDFTAEKVVTELERIIPDGPDRERMLVGLAEVRAKLRPSDIPAAHRVAQTLLELIS